MPPEERDPAYLWDMLDAAQTVRQLVAGLSVNSYLRDRRTQLAVERAIEIVRFVYAASLTGIFRSADAGETWALFAPPPEQFTGSIVIHPSDPGTLYASSRLGVFRNTGGEGWVPVSQGLSGLQVFRLTRDRTAPDRLFAGVEKENGAGAGLFAYEIVP